jgi:hypothetical protein
MATETKEDNVLESLEDLSREASGAHASFKRKLAQGALNDPAALAGEIQDLFSLFSDLALGSYNAHKDHFEWASEVDDDLEELKEHLGPESALLPEDAMKLKATILSLMNAIPSSADESAILKARGEEAVAFIDGITIEGEEDDAPEEDDEVEEATN